MPEEQKRPDEESRKSQNDIHSRWIAKIPSDHRFKRAMAGEENEKWYEEQCLFCRHYVKLAFPLGYDWGVCSNPLSPYDATLIFEHDGYDYFSFGRGEADIE